MVIFGGSVSKRKDNFSLKSIAQMEYGPLIDIDIIKPFIPNAESIKENVEKFTEIQKKLNDIIPENEKDVIILSIKYLIKLSAIYLKEYVKQNK